MSEEETHSPAEAYEKVYGNLPEGKREAVRTMCWMFTLAYECYALEHGRGETDSDRVVAVTGALAESYMARFRYLSALIGKSQGETLGAVDATSKWLEARRWISLPVYRDRDGTTVYVTADRMHGDMARKLDRVRAYRREIGERQEQCRKT